MIKDLDAEFRRLCVFLAFVGVITGIVVMVALGH